MLLSFRLDERPGESHLALDGKKRQKTYEMQKRSTNNFETKRDSQLSQNHENELSGHGQVLLFFSGLAVTIKTRSCRKDPKSEFDSMLHLQKA